MNTAHLYKLGTSANLIFGYDPNWVPGGTKVSGFFSPEIKPLKESEISSDLKTVEWGFPEVTLHDDSESLLSELLPFRVNNPSNASLPTRLPAGPLMIGDTDRQEALQTLSESLGVNLLDSNAGFALVKLSRQTGYSEHASTRDGIFVIPNPSNPDQQLGINESFRQEFIKLRPSSRHGGSFDPSIMDKKKATAYLDFFNSFGTHYISKVNLGDAIFQVFAFNQTRFKKLKDIYSEQKENLSGIEAISFSQFTKEFSGRFGYVTDYGKILSMSADPVLTESVKSGEWREHTHAQRDSIFAPYQTNSTITPSDLKAKFVKEEVIQVEFTSLALFTEFNRKNAWARVFKACISQKYKGKIVPEFVNHCRICDISKSIPQGDSSGFVSTIATPNINVYKVSLDLSQLKYVAQDQVSQMTLFSNNIHIGNFDKPHFIPGSDVLIGATQIDMHPTSQLPTIVLTDQAFDKFDIYCKKFDGILLVNNQADSKHHVIVDGLKYGSSSEEGPLGRSKIIVLDDIRTPPPIQFIDRLRTSLEYTFTLADSFVNEERVASTQDVAEFIRSSLFWIQDIIPEDTDDMDLLKLRIASIDLAKLNKDKKLGTYVPILPHQDYEKQVDEILSLVDTLDTQVDRIQDQISERQQSEQLIDVAKTLNENIKQSGELLSDFIKSTKEQQKAMAGFYENIMAKKESELASQKSRIDDLERLLTLQIGEIKNAIANYKQAVTDWQSREAIKFGLELAPNIFTLGKSIVAPTDPSDAVKALSGIANGVKAFSEVVQTTNALYSGTESGDTVIRNVAASLKALPGETEELSSNLKWDEMTIHWNDIFDTGPSDDTVVEKKDVLNKAFKILVLRGKALLDAKSNSRLIAREIYLQRRQATINAEHAQRLSSLDNALHPSDIEDLDISQIDLVGMTGSLTDIRNQMLGILAKAYTLKDQALQYEFLQPPTPIHSFSLLGFKTALVKQAGATITAKESLARIVSEISTPIQCRIDKVDTRNLLNGNAHQLNLYLDTEDFLQYSHARIKSVRIHIEGIKSTDSGKYIVNLAYEGTPFFDRDMDRNPVPFNTPRRERNYEYKVENNEPLFSDNGETWSDGVTQITPFGTWSISIPKTAINEGMKFKSNTVVVRFEFIVEGKSISPTPQLTQSLKLPATSMALADTGVPSVEELVTALVSQKAATNGWDVVFNMSIDQINKAIAVQYEDIKSNSEFKNTIDFTMSNSVTENIKAVKKFNIVYGPPNLSFAVHNEQSVELEFQIIEGELIKCVETVDTGELSCDDPIALKGETLTASIPISLIKGIVTEQNEIHSVGIILAEGSFDSGIDMSDEEAVTFNESIRAYFIKNPVQFIINSLDLRAISSLEDLTPNQFTYKALITPAGQRILQLYIMTGTRENLSSSQASLNNIPEPIPEGFECSLLISNRVLFGGVLPDSLANSGWELQGVKTEVDTMKFWYSQFSSGTISGTIDLSELNYTNTNYGGGYVVGTFSVPGGMINIDINGMNIFRTGEEKFTLSYNKTATQKFTESIKSNLGPSEKIHEVDVSITIDAKLPITISGEGRDQLIGISIENKAVSIVGKTSGGGPCCDDLESQFNTQLQAQVPGQITSKLNVTFDAISVFALKNLLFVDKNFINLSKVYATGDLLILGNFEKVEE